MSITVYLTRKLAFIETLDYSDEPDVAVRSECERRRDETAKTLREYIYALESIFSFNHN